MRGRLVLTCWSCPAWLLAPTPGAQLGAAVPVVQAAENLLLRSDVLSFCCCVVLFLVFFAMTLSGACIVSFSQ